jgi:hypothetical protein
MAVVMTGILYYSNKILFQRFIGRLNPVITIFLFAILGLFAFFYLLSKGWFKIYAKENFKDSLRSLKFAGLFAAVTILIDLAKIYLPDMSFPNICYFIRLLDFLLKSFFMFCQFQFCCFFNYSFQKYQ